MDPLMEKLNAELEAVSQREEFNSLSVTIIVLGDENNAFVGGSCCLGCALMALLSVMNKQKLLNGDGSINHSQEDYSDAPSKTETTH